MPPLLPVCNYFDSGELFAVGSFNTLRLCDKTGVSIASCKYEKLLLEKSSSFVLISLHISKITVEITGLFVWCKSLRPSKGLCNSLLVVLHIGKTKYRLDIQHCMVQWWYSACWGLWKWAGYLCSCDWKVSKYCWCQVLILCIFLVSTNYYNYNVKQKMKLHVSFCCGWLSPLL